MVLATAINASAVDMVLDLKGKQSRIRWKLDDVVKNVWVFGGWAILGNLIFEGGGSIKITKYGLLCFSLWRFGRVC